MDRSLDTRVSQAVDAWLEWLPRWRPSTHRGRTRLCRRCFGSPVMAAVGLDRDVPHTVQHGLSTRIKAIVDEVVDEYTERNLPLLQRELKAAEESKARSYRPDRGLEPEYDGLPVDPDPVPGEPYLFTLAGLAGQEVAEPEAVPAPLSEEEKSALRTEIRLADECAIHAGKLVCLAIAPHRERILAAVALYVEPQIEALLADLTLELDSPPSW
ncbi:spermidine/putrescine ABC transporter substrate-binding protein [Mycetocola zhujimingii]|uniref:Spermidine/putrescine ABC transporter substrate-binding protein n=1 Tax=Mycetocola zhujimingii TaxID=2079792 RepID=A0A2U1TDW4_9MICO|nr:spermidine/putrescine ABC transporter substrate-binding protein [Mycetocola zhujimingii]AWB87202.1 spermidine/putrescine ABC transporter substrate-binding protein [Mycetocola zhujimingii]PWC07087.1 spermidine/putrescine ABC transporter substrate-binding protein [Mycetocola zhujimingii]